MLKVFSNLAVVAQLVALGELLLPLVPLLPTATVSLALLVYLGPHDSSALVEVTSNDTSVLIGPFGSCLSQADSHKCSPRYSFTANRVYLPYLPNYVTQSTFTPLWLPSILTFAGFCMFICFILICVIAYRRLATKTSIGFLMIIFSLGWMPWLATFLWFKLKAEKDFRRKSRDQPSPQFAVKIGNGFLMMLGAFIALLLLCLITCIFYEDTFARRLELAGPWPVLDSSKPNLPLNQDKPRQWGGPWPWSVRFKERDAKLKKKRPDSVGSNFWPNFGMGLLGHSTVPGT